MKDIKPSCTQRSVAVRRQDFPICCPAENQELWNAHPRVFLSIEAEDSVVCPYCSTRYYLA